MTKPAPGPDQPPIAVRLVTLTLRPGAGADLPRLARALTAADADVVCLQTVSRGGGGDDVDPVLLLSRALDAQVAWEPPPAGVTGHALLSRLPVLVSDLHPLPGDRLALRTMIELDGAALWVTTTDLSASPAGDRAAQLAALAALHSDAMATGVLAGALDLSPGAPELAVLDGRFTEAGDPVPGVDGVWVSDGVGVAGTRVLDDAGSGRPVVVDLEVRSGV